MRGGHGDPGLVSVRPMTRTRLFLAAAALTLAVPASAAARTKVLTAGPPASSQNAFAALGVADIQDFFQHHVTIAAGDSITWKTTGFHTVTFLAKGQKLPPFTPANPKKVIKGLKDAAGNPFWFNGKPTVGLNFRVAGPAPAKVYNGNTFANSGIPQGKPTPFTLKFTKAGTYTYYCAVHPGMTGKVTVLPAGSAVPSAAADAKTVKAQVARDKRIAKNLQKVRAPKNTILAGVAGAGGVEVYRLVASAKTYRRGTVLTTEMTKKSYEAHTVTTGPAKYLKPMFFGGPVLDQRGVHRSGKRGIESLGPRLHGNGFWNSGLIDVDRKTTDPFSRKVRLANAGTYKFVCLLHPEMKVTIKVK